MSKVIGAVFGLYCFAVVTILGVIKNAALSETLSRALVAMVLGFVVGWLIFGSIGGAILSASDQKPMEEEKEKGIGSE